MAMLDLVFPVLGKQLPTDHGYALYGALSRQVQAFHDGTLPLRYAPISGEPGGRGLLRLTERSRLRLRLPEDRIRDVLCLAGRRLEVDGHGVRLGAPSVAALAPAATLAARLVTLKHHTEPVGFLEAARRKLKEMVIDGEALLPLTLSGPRAGLPCRRVVRVQARRIIGFAVCVEGLNAEESIKLQECGLGGRTRMGCGFFLPVREG